MLSDLARERFGALEKYLDSCEKSGRWLVLTHDNPDPDSLAAAAIMKRVLRTRFGRRVTAAYGGIVGRAENSTMVSTLGLELSRVRHVQFRNYKHFVLVDTQAQTGNNQLPTDIVPDIVLDHHPKRKATRDSPVVDLRTDYGATATMAAEYLLLSGLEPTRKEATAIVYAIRSETLDFSRESPGPDRAIYDHFFQIADKRLLGRIQRPRLPESYFRTLHDALLNMEIVDTLVVSHLGAVDQPDAVPETADLLLRMEGRTWALCTGRYEDRIYCSIRTTNPRANAANIMRRLLGRRGKGGGHDMIAGGWLPEADNDRATAARQVQLGQRLAKLLRKKPERLTPLLQPPEADDPIRPDDESREEPADGT